MEFLRFGSSIPGSYWGCCAVCIIQNFKMDPDSKASIQIVDGDGGTPIMDGSDFLYAGPTYKDIFLQRLRYGTFGKHDMPNHTFLAVLTSQQISGGYGAKWLALLKEQGFEFIRTVDNSVYTGQGLLGEEHDEDEDYDDGMSSHPNYIFGLFRNVGNGAIDDPFLPPKAWTDLPEPSMSQLELYKALPKNVFYTEKELEKLEVPITYAGVRSTQPQQLKSIREANAKDKTKKKATADAPW